MTTIDRGVTDAPAAFPASPASLTTKGARTRQRIVAVAAELMFAQGIGGTTLGDVRAAAMVSSSQLYHYFSDKQDLVRAVVAYRTDGIAGHQEQTRLESLEDFRAWRDEFVAYKRQLISCGGCPLGSLGSELAVTDPAMRLEVAAGFDRWEGAIREGLRAMYSGGQLALDTNPDDLALAILAALQGGLLLAQIQRDTRPLEVAFDAMITLIQRLAPSRSRRTVRPSAS